MYKVLSRSLGLVLLLGVTGCELSSFEELFSPTITEVTRFETDDTARVVGLSDKYAVVGPELFERDGDTWSQVTPLTPTSQQAFSAVSAVSISETHTAVGFNPDEKVVLFERGDAGWKEVFTFSSPVEGRTNFGATVALSDDSLAIGASGDDEAGSSSGAVYIYERSGEEWTQVDKVLPTGADAFERFGDAIALSGNTLAVGAVGHSDLSGQGGQAYIFERGSAGWEQAALLTVGGGADGFGRSVDVQDNRVLVGASGAEEGVLGEAYVFERTPARWLEVAKLLPSDPPTTPEAVLKGDGFGSAVAFLDTYAIVGADGVNQSAGAFYVFEDSGSGWLERNKITPDDLTASSFFGENLVAFAGHILVGSRTNTAYLYKISGFELPPIGDVPPYSTP